MTLTPENLDALETTFQFGVALWMRACFGEKISADELERSDRFIEEALELAQTIPEFTADRAHALVDYVFGRPVGERYQEVGGVMVTLAALCNATGLNINAEAERELNRVWTKVDAIRAKQAAKPTGSALPITWQSQAARERDALRAENERLRDVLTNLSSYLGAGLGDDATTPEQFDQRIRWGIDHVGQVYRARAAAIVEACSRRPSTTWGQVKRAVLDDTCLPTALKGETQ